MKAILDNNLPYSLAALLKQDGHDVAHVVDLKLADAADSVIRKHFLNQSIIFVTRDNDFWIDAPPSWCVVWLSLHNPKLEELKGPIRKQLATLITTASPGQKILVTADGIQMSL